MSSCMRCGAFTEHGSGLCGNCEASSSSGIGTPEDVPCQRCGMYLPSHELRMWNSRLYCSYCIMDIQDEDKMGRPSRKGEGRQQESTGISGTCDKCGKQSGSLFFLQGLRLCQQCFSASGGEAGIGWKPHFGQIVQRIKKALGIQPKIIVNAVPVEQQSGAQPQPVQGEAPTGGQVFDIKNRQMEDKKSGIQAQPPMSEERHEEKKPAPKAKKFFFGMHPTAKGNAEQGHSRKK